jgi:rubrerythrin
MQAVIDRAHCLKHPFKIVRLFGLDVFLGMLLRTDKTLLERIAEKYRARRIAMPGTVGSAYKLSALFEYRVAHIYGAMAERFRSIPEAHRLFLDLKEEEMEHGRLMLACLYQVAVSPDVQFVPSVRDPEIRESLNELRRIEREVAGMSLEQALATTGRLEASEVNTIFGRLLKQVGKAETELFAEELRGAKSHPESVPRRIKELRERLGPERSQDAHA